MRDSNDPDLRQHARHLLNRLTETLEQLRGKYTDSPSQEAIDDANSYTKMVGRCLDDIGGEGGEHE